MDPVALLYKTFDPHIGVSTDSRSVKEGQIFFALHGPSFDGNLFADKALKAGASIAVVDRADVVIKSDKRYLPVTDALSTLQQLSLLHRRTLRTPLIQVTGTNGKTTTKELIAAALSVRYNVLATVGNLNNHIGVPLTLLRLLPDHQYGVIETGANHPGEIGFLTRLVEPQYGIITNVQKAHLEGFHDLPTILRTKTALYDYLRRHDGTAIFNADNPLLARLATTRKRVAYASLSKMSCVALSYSLTSANPCTLSWGLSHSKTQYTLRSHLAGDYNATNLAAALTTASLLGVPPADSNQVLARYTPRLGRSQLLKTRSNTVLVDAYNANPDSMRAALRNFFTLEGKKKLLILGQMNELGSASLLEHQSLLSFIARYADSNVLRAILIGPNFDHAAPPSCDIEFLRVPSTSQAALLLQQSNLKGYTILLKGSNTNRLESLLSLL